MSATAASPWSQLSISEIADFGSGEMISVAHLQRRRSQRFPIPVYGGNGVAGYTSIATTKDPTVILGRVGQKCGVVYQNTEPVWITDNALYARRFKRPVDVRFFARALEAARLNDVKNKNDLPLITQGILQDVKLAWPNTIAEQRAIADALSVTDELIEGMDRVIQKKLAVKQGFMQQLLTGRTRLPGHSGEWVARKIGDFAQVKTGGTPSTAIGRYWGGNIRWMSSGEIHKKRVHEVAGRITGDGLRESAAQLFPIGTVLIALAGQGRTRGTVAVSRVELTTNQSLAGILPGGQHDPDFLYYNLDARYAELRGESSGDGGRGGLNLTLIKNLEVAMPGVDEQVAISRVLGDVDDEIAALTLQLEKIRAIRSGMMQQLLTGRVRLPAEVAT